jgi:hypothetical protein
VPAAVAAVTSGAVDAPVAAAQAEAALKSIQDSLR